MNTYSIFLHFYDLQPWPSLIDCYQVDHSVHLVSLFPHYHNLLLYNCFLYIDYNDYYN